MRMSRRREKTFIVSSFLTRESFRKQLLQYCLGEMKKIPHMAFFRPVTTRGLFLLCIAKDKNTFTFYLHYHMYGE